MGHIPVEWSQFIVKLFTANILTRQRLLTNKIHLLEEWREHFLSLCISRWWFVRVRYVTLSDTKPGTFGWCCRHFKSKTIPKIQLTNDKWTNFLRSELDVIEFFFYINFWIRSTRIETDNFSITIHIYGTMWKKFPNVQQIATQFHLSDKCHQLTYSIDTKSNFFFHFFVCVMSLITQLKFNFSSHLKNPHSFIHFMHNDG